MSHKKLPQKQRYHIYGLWCAGYNQVQIAEEIGVHKSTISREFNEIHGGMVTFRGKHNGLAVIVDVKLKKA